MPEIVWMVDENERRFPAELVNRGASFSTLRYVRGGIEYEVFVENDEYEFEGEDDIDGDEG